VVFLFVQRYTPGMNKLSIALTALMLLGLVAFMAPNIFVLNRGKVLRNIALWLAIFAGLGLIYQTIYGGNGPAGIERLMSMRRAARQQPEENASPPAAGNKNGSHYNFTPPGE
jgi:hypothetical protein